MKVHVMSGSENGSQDIAGVLGEISLDELVAAVQNQSQEMRDQLDEALGCIARLDTRLGVAESALEGGASCSRSSLPSDEQAVQEMLECFRSDRHEEHEALRRRLALLEGAQGAEAKSEMEARRTKTLDEVERSLAAQSKQLGESL